MATASDRPTPPFGEGPRWPAVPARRRGGTGGFLGALRRYLLDTGHYFWRPGRRAVAIETGKVTDHGGDSYEAHWSWCVPATPTRPWAGPSGPPRPGAAAAVPLADDADGTGRSALGHLRRRRRLDALLPGFDLPGRAGLPAPSEATETFGMQLLLVERASGELTIGDTHVYREPFDFAVEASSMTGCGSRAEAILGWTLPPVVRRWAGVYSAATDDRICLREEATPGWSSSPAWPDGE